MKLYNTPETTMSMFEVRQSMHNGTAIARTLAPLHSDGTLLRYKAALTVQAIAQGVHSAAEMAVEYSRGQIDYQSALAGVRYLVRRVPGMVTSD